MRHSSTANVLLACLWLVSCASAQRSNSVWDNVDYSHTSLHGKAARDYDADYSLPSTAGCMDDAPDCH